MDEKLLDKIDAIFEQKLQAKTGWGRKDVLMIYQQAKGEAALALLKEVSDGK